MWFFFNKLRRPYIPNATYQVPISQAFWFWRRRFLNGFNPLSLTGSILSNTDLSDLSTVGTCDIFVYQMRYRVMWFARLADSILFIKRVITCHWNGFYENAIMWRMFSKMLSAYNMISLWLNTVIPIIVMIWLPKMTRYLHWRIVCRQLTLVTF